MKKIIFILALFMTSCYSDKAKFDFLKNQYPNCEILSHNSDFYAVDTTHIHGAIYKIDFHYSNNISTVDRLR